MVVMQKLARTEAAAAKPRRSIQCILVPSRGSTL
jgi:hypothetical protein